LTRLLADIELEVSFALLLLLRITSDIRSQIDAIISVAVATPTFGGSVGVQVSRKLAEAFYFPGVR
jgi:hypothetical protein